MIVPSFWTQVNLFWFLISSSICREDGMSHLDGSLRPDHSRTQSQTIIDNLSAVVVFGDSYSDDGRHQNEPIENPYVALGSRSRTVAWPVHLAQQIRPDNQVKLFNYAYNNAQANNQLTNFSINPPDTRQQTLEFLDQLKKGDVLIRDKKTLILWWIGINPIDDIWQEACGPQPNGGAGAAAASDVLFQKAIQRVDLQVKELQDQVLHLSSILSDKKKSAAAYVLITIPDVSKAQLQRGFVETWANGDAALSKRYLDLLINLINRYNQGIIKFAKELRYKHGHGANQALLEVYDVTKLWNDLFQNPGKYRIKNTSESCLLGSSVCQNPDDFLFWDYLHPTPKVHKLIATDLLQFLRTLG